VGRQVFRSPPTANTLFAPDAGRDAHKLAWAESCPRTVKLMKVQSRHTAAKLDFTNGDSGSNQSSHGACPLFVTGDRIGFDIQTTEAGENTAWLASGGMLHTVNMETGGAEKVDEGLDPDLRDLAILQ
jgi:hypothetical protein